MLLADERLTGSLCSTCCGKVVSAMQYLAFAPLAVLTHPKPSILAAFD